MISNHSDYIVLVVGLVGTTITPWMQFYLQASIVEKGIGKRQYALSRWDVILGCIVTDVIAFFIVVACAATLYVNGNHNITDAADAALALKPLAGQMGVVAVCRGTGQRRDALGGDSAAGHRLQHLRRPGRGIRA